MKSSLCKYLSCIVAVATALPAFAGSETEYKSKMVKPVECPPTALTLLQLDSSYTFNGRLRRGEGRQSVWHNEFKFGERIPLHLFSWPNRECGEWFLRLGADYERFDFDTRNETRLPNVLQSIAGVIALEYLVRGQAAILIESRPGVYFQQDITGETFDAPTDIAAAFEIKPDKLYFVGGVSLSLLRSYHVLPILGVKWFINDKWILNAVVPQPRLIYNQSDRLQLWLGGELVGGAYKTDNRFVQPQKLSGAVVNYTEYRVGAGLTYSVKPFTFELGGGYTIQREFEYRRARESFITSGGAPFIKAEISAAF